MNPFEFVMVLVTIIIALGVAELLTGIARIMRRELGFYWIHMVWIFTLLVMQLQYCWSLFDLEARNEWVFLDLVRLLTPPIIFFLASSLLFPSRDERIDLKKYYFAKRKPIFALLFSVMSFYAVSSLSMSLLSLVQFAGVAITGILIVTDRPRLHALLALMFAFATLLFVASFSYTLGESAFG